MFYKLHNLFNPKVKDTAQMCSRKLRERRREKEKERDKEKERTSVSSSDKKIGRKKHLYNSKLI